MVAVSVITKKPKKKPTNVAERLTESGFKLIQHATVAPADREHYGHSVRVGGDVQVSVKCTSLDSLCRQRWVS